ncbi:aromatic ring-hydroxylating oxygenase subunit alpha [Planctomicrobium sp. SH668]|uniref:aromatic ring-hydroxylating oxygenase subunit alpha n=1 Tax=Planctomicrobium sp. SH668 TaxID=3448126 RepID=UPI003F5C6542
MYITQTSMTPALASQEYSSEESWKLERKFVFGRSWHLVGTKTELARHGDYLSREILGVPVVIRNFQGDLVALRNVFAHRQALLTTKASGRSESLKCPYHGWEYGADGLTRKIPGAVNFPKFDRPKYALDRFHLDSCGDLVFVRLSEEGPTLREWIGERFDLLNGCFSTSRYHLATRFRFDYTANWKIPVENSLESYHIPYVHPNTFHTDPAEANSSHFLHDTGTSFTAKFHPPRMIDALLDRTEQVVLRILGEKGTGIYHHHHIFPNLLISHTDSTSFIQMIYPSGPATCHSLVWQYGLGDREKSFFPRMVAFGWGKFMGTLSKTIVNEDIAVYALVQAGAAAATRPGILGRCEERIYASQEYVRSKIEQGQLQAQKASVRSE